MKRIALHTRTALPFAVLILFAAAMPASEVAAQTFGLRSSTSIDSDWSDCRSWDTAVPDEYTAASINRSVTLENNSHVARAASLTIDATNGGTLTIRPGASLTITQETSTPPETRRYDETTWLMTHNAFAAYEYNVVYAQQNGSITDQLEDGVRGLMLDVYEAKQLDEDLYLCHNNCAIPFINPNTLPPYSGTIGLSILARAFLSGVAAPPVLVAVGLYVAVDEGARMKLGDGLDEIKEFLDDNPNAIITIIIEDDNDGASAAAMFTRFQDAGLASYMYDPKTDGPNGTTGCWPSLEWMRQNNKRLVVFMQDGRENPGENNNPILGQFAYTVENGFSSTDEDCTDRSESYDLDERSRKLFVMNHFEEAANPIDFLFQDGPNEAASILARVEDECFPNAGRYPNFLSVNFYELPDNGPAQVVDILNARWRPDGWITPRAAMASTPVQSAEAAAKAPAANAKTSDLSKTEVLQAADEAAELPEQFELLPNYPNPFNPSTQIPFAVPEAGPVRLAVYDVLGREVAVLVDGSVAAGRHSATFEASDLPSGTYVYRLETPQGFHTQIMLLVK